MAGRAPSMCPTSHRGSLPHSTPGPETALAPLQLQDLAAVRYEDGQHHGLPVVLGTGGFGRVELVRPSSPSRQAPVLGGRAAGGAEPSPYQPALPSLEARPQCLAPSRPACPQVRGGGQLFALKRIRKDHVVRKRQQGHVHTEKRVLEQSRCPFIVG